MAEHFDLIVRNGTLVSGDARRPADIGVRDGLFAAIEPAGTLAGSAQCELDATNRHVLPGLIDGHVHFREPGLEHKEDWLSGSRAAVMGGVTTVLDMPNTVPPTATVAEAEHKADLASRRSYADFGLFGLLGGQSGDDVRRLIESGLVVGLKVFLGPTTGDLAPPTDDQLTAGLALARDHGLRVAFHAEDAAIIAGAEARLRQQDRHDPRAHLLSRPVEAELAGIDRACRLLAETGAAGHILHLSSAAGIGPVQAWRARGVDLTCEASAHHCLLSADDYDRLGGLIKCNPPVREAEDGRELMRGLADGRIDCIASDHAPHAPPDKQPTDIWRVAPGIAGVETTLPLLLTHAVDPGHLTLERLVSAFAERPAQAWGLWPQKGAIEVGSDADLTVIDLASAGVIRSTDLHGRHGPTPFEGWPTRGAAVATVVRGQVLMSDGALLGRPGWGRRVSAARRGGSN